MITREPAIFDDRPVSLAKLLATNVASAFECIDTQRELESRQRVLEHQLERLDAFGGIVSQDLRNLLSVANGPVELLQADLGVDARGWTIRATEGADGAHGSRYRASRPPSTPARVGRLSTAPYLITRFGYK